MFLKYVQIVVGRAHQVGPLAGGEVVPQVQLIKLAVHLVDDIQHIARCHIRAHEMQAL